LNGAGAILHQEFRQAGDGFGDAPNFIGSQSIPSERPFCRSSQQWTETIRKPLASLTRSNPHLSVRRATGLETVVSGRLTL
jgi:hypothetical protein